MIFSRNLLASIAAMIGLLWIVPILILALPFWLVSILTRACIYLLQPAHVPWKELVVSEPKIGWKPKPNLNAYYLAIGDDVCHITTDAQGWIGRHTLEESDIVVFGDSFAFGYGVDLRDSYLELDPRLKIKAIASPGYNMVQELLLMRQYAHQLTDKLVVWFICLENDLLDNLRPNKPNFYRTPFIRRVDGGSEWEIETGHVNPTKWPYPTLKHPYAEVFAQLFAQSPLSEFVYSSCDYLLSEGRSVCQQAGAQLSILTIPKKQQLSREGILSIASLLENNKDFDPDLLDHRFGEVCQKLSLPYISARDYLQSRDYKTYDVHWTQEGHRKIVKLVADLYRTCKL